jgi:hypothetical protein
LASCTRRFFGHPQWLASSGFALQSWSTSGGHPPSASLRRAAPINALAPHQPIAANETVRTFGSLQWKPKVRHQPLRSSKDLYRTSSGQCSGSCSRLGRLGISIQGTRGFPALPRPPAAVLNPLHLDHHCRRLRPFEACRLTPRCSGRHPGALGSARVIVGAGPRHKLQWLAGGAAELIHR